MGMKDRIWLPSLELRIKRIRVYHAQTLGPPMDARGKIARLRISRMKKQDSPYAGFIWLLVNAFVFARALGEPAVRNPQGETASVSARGREDVDIPVKNTCKHYPMPENFVRSVGRKGKGENGKARVSFGKPVSCEPWLKN